ncbi:hypothetical protein F4X73_01825 [Candidatus Poribacteria bacterium]|nr:hypothetical protein [Candidatus Poribacteria bacterium]MYF56951.1 hypothetical protein [Candidatus Poribacteria bacterium]
MRNKVIWGFAILIILLIGVSVFLITRNTETDPEIVYRPLTPEEKKEVDRNIQEIIDKAKKDQPPIAEVEVEKPQPVENPVPVPRNSGAGIIPNYGLVELENPTLNKWIRLRTTNVPGIDIDWASLSPEELADTIAKLERGEISAPEGYYYRKTVPDSSGELILDENGYPMIHKKGEYVISVLWTMEFRPPPDVWEEYDRITDRKSFLKGNIPDSPEIGALEAKMAEIERTYRGPLPTTFGMSGSPENGARSRADRMKTRITVDLYTQMGFRHLLRRPPRPDGYYSKPPPPIDLNDLNFRGE